MQETSSGNAANSQTGRAPDTQSYARSKLSNGGGLFLADVDGRSREARRYRDVFADLVSHLGGQDYASESRKHLAKRATALIVWCEVIEAKLAAGEDLDVAPYTTATNTLRRLLLDLGLDPASRNVTPDVRRYLNGSDSPAAGEFAGAN